MMIDPQHRWQVLIAAALLRQGRWLAALALGLLLIALGSLVVAFAMGRAIWAVPHAISLLAGVVALWIALRVTFDADLFAALAQDDDLSSFDQAMVRLGLLPVERVGRSLELRVQGAMRLLKLLAIAVGFQFAALVFGTVLVFLVWTP